MTLDVNDIAAQIDENTLTLANALPADADVFQIVDIIAGLPNSAIVVKGANNWHGEWIEKFKKSMIEFICSDKKDCLDALMKSNGVTSKNVVAVCSAYVAAQCGLVPAAISAVIGGVLLQVAKRGKDSFCSVVYKPIKWLFREHSGNDSIMTPSRCHI